MSDDISSLWIDTGAKDALTETVTTVKLGKPKDFFRTHPSPDMRRKVEIVAVKTEGSFEDQIFLDRPQDAGQNRGSPTRNIGNDHLSEWRGSTYGP